MARILSGTEWYDEISASSMYEIEFENVFVAQSEILFPEYITMPFKFTVESSEGTAKADLALIDKNYLGWWVVEVEMSRHSLNRHVLPQVKILSEANYTERVATYFVSKQPLLNLVKLKDMMKGVQPRVMVVLDRPKPAWETKLEKYNAILAIFQIFRTTGNEMLYRINGQYPFSFDAGSSNCYFENLLSNFLIVESPAILDIVNDERIEIYHEGSLTVWKRLDIQDKIYLIPTGFNPLNVNRKYILLKDIAGKYYINQL